MLERTGADSHGKPYRGIPMEGLIARWYARSTRIDMPDFERLAERISDALPAGSRILEVASGPGYLALELAKRRMLVEGADISDTFVRIANDNAHDAMVPATFRKADVHALPYADASFDCVVCRAALKNFSRPTEALREMWRVLRTGQQALVIDMRRDVEDEELEQFATDHSSGRLEAWWNGWVFKSMLRNRAYLVEDVQRMAMEAGFTECDIRRELIGFEAWMRR